ncbi:hypothetical protein Asal01_02514 [Fodinibius salicampi]
MGPKTENHNPICHLDRQGEVFVLKPKTNGDKNFTLLDYCQDLLE